MSALSRRTVMAGAGALVLRFTLPASAQPASRPLPGSLKTAPLLDAWIRVESSGMVTVFTGKAELGQGIATALLQVAAEELSITVDRMKLVTADTALSPNEQYTAGSHSLQDSGTAIRMAAAQVRQILLLQATALLQAPIEQLKVGDAAVIGPDGRRISYGALVPAGILHVPASPQTTLRDPAGYTVVGHAVPRIDIPGKVTGRESYVQDLRLAGMLHARVVRPPHVGARLLAVDSDGVMKLPGMVQVVHDGSFLAVVAKREYQAIQAMRALARVAQWQGAPARPAPQADLFAFITALPTQDTTILDQRTAVADAAKTLTARYTRPYQMHASIGPSCAVAQWTDSMLTVWTHTQGVYPDRKAISELLRLPEAQVRCIHVPGSGCYGHNGADDAAADAALIAHAVPDRPVRLQWMREQEHAWEPLGPAMATELRASLDTRGRIADWDYTVWSNTHNGRPGNAGSLLAGRLVEQPFTPPPPRPIPMPEGGGDRNAIPLYALPSAHVVSRFIPEMPLHVSALRSLGAYMNVFSIESFMDELASAAGADPVEFRLRHLEDPRARDVITRAAEQFGWGRTKPDADRGRGFAFARYKNLAAYCALAVEIAVERETGRTRLVRAVAAVDAGQVVNPDGLINQIEGSILQSSSWTLYESALFDATGVTARDWSSYPILRFDSVPESVAVHIIDRPGMPFLGAGEAGQGPTAAAIGNALANATGQRLRDLPFSRERVKAAVGV